MDRKNEHYHIFFVKIALFLKKIYDISLLS